MADKNIPDPENFGATYENYRREVNDFYRPMPSPTGGRQPLIAGPSDPPPLSPEELEQFGFEPIPEGPAERERFLQERASRGDILRVPLVTPADAPLGSELEGAATGEPPEPGAPAVPEGAPGTPAAAPGEQLGGVDNLVRDVISALSGGNSPVSTSEL